MKFSLWLHVLALSGLRLLRRLVRKTICIVCGRRETCLVCPDARATLIDEFPHNLVLGARGWAKTVCML